MSANARFDAALLKLLDKHDAVHAATTPMERHLAITIRNDAMLAVQMMFSAEHAECRRLRAKLEEVTR